MTSLPPFVDDRPREHAVPEGLFRYRLDIAYLGAGFAGWQRQLNADTVQARVEAALSELVGESVAVVGASRTDAGVHARAQVAHIDLSRPFSTKGLVFGSNHHLPRKFGCSRPVWRRRDSTPASPPPRRSTPIASGRDDSSLLTSRRSSSPFPIASTSNACRRRRCSSPGGTTSPASPSPAAATVRRSAPCSAPPGSRRPARFTLRIAGDGFLRGMVRGLVGTLLEVALGQRSLASFTALLAGGERGTAGPTAPAHALALERIDYRPHA